MSVKALDLILKLTEELRGAKHAENSEGRASARLFIKSRRIGRAASRHWAGSQSRPGLRRVRSLNPALCPGGTAVSVCGCSTLNQER